MAEIARSVLKTPIVTTAKICLTSNFLNSPNLKAAQTFEVDAGTWNITSAEIYLSRLNNGGDDAGTITVRLREDSPTGTILGTQTKSRLDLSVFSSFDYETFTFSGFQLSSGNTYCITIECPAGHHNSGNDVDSIIWPQADSYANGVGYIYSDPAGWVIQSQDWTFRINGTSVGLPEKATTPAPGSGISTVKLSLTSTTWVDGGAGNPNAADTYNVYYGTASGSLSLVSSTQAPLSFTVTGITDGSPYSYLITRYWRIDSTNGVGTTTGDEWSFTTIRFKPPGPTYQSDSGFYYQLLVDEDDNWGTPPPIGIEDTDYVVVSYEPNFISTTRKLVVAVGHQIWYENI